VIFSSTSINHRSASLKEAARRSFLWRLERTTWQVWQATERARRQRERVAWTLVGVVGIDPGEAVAAGWPGPHLKDEGCLLSPLSTARPSPYLSLSASHSPTLLPTMMRGRAGEKRKRRKEQRNHVSGVLVFQKKEKERKKVAEPLTHPCIPKISSFYS